MPRPQPTVLLAATYRSGMVDEVLQADAIYAVYYQRKPVNLRSVTAHGQYKYRKVSFSNPGHAYNLAERLNKKFNTKAFTVVTLRPQ